jgi:hypothetical protein
MIQSRRVDLLLASAACLAVVLSAQPALACSVCTGDPSSAMNQGLQAGVLVLLGVVGAILMGFAALLLFWVRRAAQLRTETEAGETARGSCC